MVAIKVYDKLEQQMPSEKMVVSNQIHQVNIDGKNKKTRTDLSTDFDANYAQFKSDLEKHKVHVFKVNTSEPVESQLLKLSN